MSTKAKTTNENPERYLIEAANILIKGFKTPANLLEFLTRSINWIEDYNDEKEEEKQTVKSDTFFIRMLIDQLLHPWVKGEQNYISSIANGLKEVFEWYGYEDYLKNISIVQEGFAFNVSQTSYVSEIMKMYMFSFNTMYEIGFCIEAYEHKMDKIREQKKLSEAA